MIISEILELKKNKIRVRFEDGNAFVLYKKEAALYDLKEGDFVPEEVIREIQQEILVKRARKRVMYLLQKSDKTEKQLRDKLREGEYPQEVIEDAINYVKSFHYLDDERYAANYVHYHQNQKSQMQLKLDLMHRGVSKDKIEQAIEEELEVSPEELIKKWLMKKSYNQGTADESEKRRVYQFLLRKGFKSNEILKCMNIDEYF